MFEQISELEIITAKLECVDSLFSCLVNSYFIKDKPNAQILAAKYNDYTNIIHVIWDMVSEQNNTLKEIVDSLFTAYRVINEVGEVA